MKIRDGIEYFTIAEVARQVGVSIVTIRNWEEYERELGYTFLPQPRRDLDGRLTRYYTYDAIAKFKEFQETKEYGIMANVSRRKWGKRGLKL